MNSYDDPTATSVVSHRTKKPRLEAAASKSATPDVADNVKPESAMKDSTPSTTSAPTQLPTSTSTEMVSQNSSSSMATT